MCQVNHHNIGRRRSQQGAEKHGNSSEQTNDTWWARSARSRCPCNRGVDESGSASHVNHLCSTGVVTVERLSAVASGGSEDTHGVLQAHVARRLSTSRQLHAEREVVDVRRSRGGSVRDGVSKAIIAFGVGQAASVV